MSVFWSKNDPSQVDEDYKELVGEHHTEIETPEDIAALNQFLKEEFSLKHDIRWVGVIKTFKTPGIPNTGGQHDAFFLVHEEDLPKISKGERIDLGFRWWFDIVGNGSARLYPLKFRRMYNRDPADVH